MDLGDDKKSAEEPIPIGTRVVVSRMKQPQCNNAHGVVVNGRTPPGRIAVKFDNPKLGTKAIRVGNVDRKPSVGKEDAADVDQRKEIR